MYRCSLQFSKQTKKVNLMHEAWIQLRCLLTAVPWRRTEAWEGFPPLCSRTGAEGALYKKRPRELKSNLQFLTAGFQTQICPTSSCTRILLEHTMEKKYSLGCKVYVFRHSLSSRSSRGGDLSSIVAKLGCSCRSCRNLVLCQSPRSVR